MVEVYANEHKQKDMFGTIILVFVLLLLLLSISTACIQCPYTSQRAASGVEYRVGPTAHRMPELTYPKGVPRLLKQEVLDRQLELYHYAQDLFASLQMTYWGITGTWIGAERHGGLIPWDDDIDLAILHDEVPTLLAALPRIQADGYDLITRGGAIKLIPKTFVPFPFIDMVIMKEDDHNMKLCYPLNDKGECTFEKSNEWPKEVYPMDRIFPLRHIPFEDTTIPVPKDVTMLNETYAGYATMAFNKPYELVNNHANYALLWKLGLNPAF